MSDYRVVAVSGDAAYTKAHLIRSFFSGDAMYTFETRLRLPVEQAIPKVLEQLKPEGFGVLADRASQ